MKNHILQSKSFLHQLLFAIMAVLIIIIITGCGSTSSSNSSVESESTMETNEGEYHEIIHQLGVTQVPDEPERIAVLSSNFVDNLYVFDIIPIVAGESALSNEKISSLLPQDLYEDVQFISEDEVDLEVILAAEPDLIIGQEKTGKIYEELSKIAPTVILGNDDWRETHFNFGEILGRDEEAQAWMDQYEQKAEEAKQKISESIGEETVAFMRVLPKEFRLHGTTDQRFIDGTLFQDLGLNPANGVPEERQAISLEGIALVNADHFFLDYNTASQENDQAIERYKSLTESVIWQQLTAVENDNVYLVPDWFIQVSPYARSMVIDYVVETLVE
ncbi:MULTISPECIES: ABC transporter substrate-binding protein [Paraliobacillus]|uniref:ABC transporter substrate-binding protein n=1 Tax=Paraliobacillus TaxID=200903 RepID=UPI0013002AEA|nr:MULTISPECIES: ABC transporter substrate-binding protein [Paraliobacillus]